MSRRLPPAWLWAVCLATALCIAGLRHASQDPPLGTLEDTLLDLRFRLRGPRPAPEGVLIVAVDDASLASIGLMAPLRESLASAVQRLEAAGAGSIVIDLVLVEPTSADAHLARILSASPSTVLAVAAAPGGVARPSPELDAALRASAFPVVVRSGAAPAPWPLLLPASQLAVAAGKLGHVNIALSRDRVARRVPLAIGSSPSTSTPTGLMFPPDTKAPKSICEPEISRSGR